MTPENAALGPVTAEARTRLDASLSRFLAERPGVGIRSLRWLTGQRRAYVLELLLDDGSRWFVKLGCALRPRIRWFVAREYLHGLLVQQTVAATARSQVAKMAGYHPEQLAFYVAELPGERLDDVLIRLCRRGATEDALEQAREHCREAARWLRHFQQQLPYDDPDAPQTRADLLARIQAETARLVSRSGGLFGSRQQRRIDAQAERLLAGLPGDGLPLAPKHNDYAPWNLMAGADGIAVFDFANIRQDLAGYDAWYFHQGLLSLATKPGVAGQHIRACAAAFLQAYGNTDHDPAGHYFRLLFQLNRMNAVVANAGSLPRRLLQRARLLPLLLQLHRLR